jgi:hypothetical protein
MPSNLDGIVNGLAKRITFYRITPDELLQYDDYSQNRKHARNADKEHVSHFTMVMIPEGADRAFVETIVRLTDELRGKEVDTTPSRLDSLAERGYVLIHEKEAIAFLEARDSEEQDKGKKLLRSFKEEVFPRGIEHKASSPFESWRRYISTRLALSTVHQEER